MKVQDKLLDLIQNKILECYQKSFTTAALCSVVGYILGLLLAVFLARFSIYFTAILLIVLSYVVFVVSCAVKRSAGKEKLGKILLYLSPLHILGALGLLVYARFM